MLEIAPSWDAILRLPPTPVYREIARGVYLTRVDNYLAYLFRDFARMHGWLTIHHQLIELRPMPGGRGTSHFFVDQRDYRYLTETYFPWRRMEELL